MRRRLAAFLFAAALLQSGSATAAGAPAIPAVWVTGVTQTSATLRAEVNPEGHSTRYHFEYLTLTAYEANLNSGGEGFEGARVVPSASGTGVGAGSQPVKVAFTLGPPANPLAPGTPYRYRAVAVNEAGTTSSDPRQLRTEASGIAAGLPDGRVWEMVSPVDKGGGAIAGPGRLFGGGQIQAASGGGALTYGSAAAFGDPPSAPPVSQYLSVRGAAGWSTADISQSLESGGYGDEPEGAPFRLFSPDLGRGLMLDGKRCIPEGTCPRSYSLWMAGSLTAIPTVAGLQLEGASADLSHLVFAADDGLFEWSGGALEQISGIGGATLAAPIGAVSADGSRVYFSLPEDGPVYLYEAGAGTRPVPETVGGGTAFQASSADGSVAYFTKGGELYRYSADTEISTPIAAGVAGVLAVSAAGDRVYYQDASGLQAWHAGTVQQIAAGAGAALPSDHPPAAATVRLGADGTVLAFLSAAPIGGYDNTDAETGLPDVEAYLYDAVTDRLLCASCNPTGERPAGSASIPGPMVNGSSSLYRPRALSANGRRFFFDTTDALVGGDTDSAADVYQWEAAGEGGCVELPGCVNLISGGRGEGGSFLDASADGADAFFLTGDSLVGVDPGSIDAYDARVGGGLPEPQAPIPCNGDACQALPPPPADPTAGTSTEGAGNPPPHYAKEGRRHRPRHPGKHRHHRHRKGHRHGKRAR